jgi:ankyrin repeat protein
MNHGINLGLNRANSNGNTPLMMASMRCPEIVDMLLEKKCNVNRQNDHGDTALIKAVASRQLEIVKALVTRGGVDTKKRNNNGLDALEKARNMITETGKDVTEEEKTVLSNIALFLRHLKEKEFLQSQAPARRNVVIQHIYKILLWCDRPLW